MTDPLTNDVASFRQVRLFAIILIPILVILAVAYFTLFRSELVILANGLRSDEAAAIVTELKKQDVAYELRQQGSTILVESEVADDLRLSLVAQNVAAGGSVGFELFNQSDMGLTDFAQKVNYQRALQGELARTIMGMDGIASARVHLALPERTLFRTNRSEPRAAVTVLPKPNIVLDAARVSGIQRLVSSTVADLRVDNVAVLNQRGQLVSQELGEHSDRAGMSEASALEKAYADRAGRAISISDPQLAFDVKVTTMPRNAAVSANAAVTPLGRDHAIRVVIFTSSEVPPDRQTELARIVASAIGARRSDGDDIRFSLRPQAMPPTVAVGSPTSLHVEEPDVGSLSTTSFNTTWVWLVLSGLAVGLAALMLVRGQRRRSVRRERLVVQLRDQLRLDQASAA